MSKRQALLGGTLVLIAALMLVWSFAPNLLSPGENKQPVVALVLDTDIGLHAATIKQGAKLAARELKADLSAVAPAPQEDAEAAQRALIERQLAAGCAAVMLVPASDAVLHEAEALAREHGARLVALDAGANKGVPYVGTDHAASGAQAIEALLSRADGPMTLLILTADGDVMDERLAGAMRAIDGAGDLILPRIISVSADEQADETVRMRLADDPSINAILCLSGALSEGAARALTALGAARDVMLVGFDCDQTRITPLQSGVIRATVLRAPLNIGYLGVTRALEENGDIYIESYVVDKDNMLEPQFVKLVFPLVQ